MDINQLISDPYLRLLFIGLVFYLGTVFLFIEKVEKIVKSKKEKHDADLEKKYPASKATIKNVIEMFDSLRENRFQYEKISRILDSLHWIGILYLSGAILGFVLKTSNLNQDISLVIMGVSFLYFFILLVYLIIWHHKNK